ncbi:hypothetical protein GJ496_011872 [Pomphorhynchus laevis]|nr:hypothetical protein GJ496_011872 [Pomphorhynchus laevis]
MHTTVKIEMRQPFSRRQKDAQGALLSNANSPVVEQLRINMLLDNPLSFKLFGNMKSFYQFSQNFFRRKFHERQLPSPRPNNSLQIQKTIGRGAFGIVAVATLDSQLCAVKIFDRNKLVKTKQAQRTIYEKAMMSSLIHPNVVQFLASFKDNSNLYICMRIVRGGELFVHMRRLKRFDENTSRQLSAQILLAFEYLQKLHVAHRDIKPENILLEGNGYIKLTDFGFAKHIRGRTYTLCGTPEYLAPEVILQRGYGLSTDWWSIGVLIYELNFGTTPFLAIEQSKMYERITRGKYRQPDFFSESLVDLIRGLLIVDPSKRLGCLTQGAEDITRHPWFKSIDWWELFSQKTEMRFKPTLKNATDLSNFDTSKLNLKEAEKEMHRTIFQDF